jgi:hypothetical protein
MMTSKSRNESDPSRRRREKPPLQKQSRVSRDDCPEKACAKAAENILSGL